MASENNKDVQDLAFCHFIINSLPAAVIAVNSELKIIHFNAWAEEVTGYSLQEALGRYCGDILQGGECKTLCPLKTVLNRQNPLVRIETTIKNKSGETIPVRMNTAALLDDDDRLIGGVEAFLDISDLKALELEKINTHSMIAHDMKSSLAIIGGFILRLLNKTGQIDADKETRYLEITRKEVSKLEVLINDFIEISNLKNGELKLDFLPTSIDKELLELIAAYEPKALSYENILEFESSEALPIIMADANRMRRVFTNLLDNAIKHSKAGGKVVILTQETEQDIIVKFIDEGTGINPKELESIFDLFHRSEEGSKKEGFGLGLAVVKTIVEGHGGSVLAESELGKGSVFTVILPKQKNGSSLF